MNVGEMRKFLESYKDEQEVAIEMVPTFKIGVKPEAVEAEIIPELEDGAK